MKDRNYPRPSMVRGDYVLLDGLWDFAFDDKEIGFSKGWLQDFPAGSKIVVPFSYQTEKSGINNPKEHPCLWYRKEVDFRLPRKSDRVLLHFEGVDYWFELYVNGIRIGEHQGAYTRASFDITDALDAGHAEIILRCIDRKEATQPRGKQTWLAEPFGCWYKETNGVWKTVWAECVSPTRIDSMKITPDLDEYFTEFELDLNRLEKDLSAEISISFKGTLISKTTVACLRRITNVKIDMNNDLDGFRVHYWTPEAPNLYDVSIRLLKGERQIDSITSRFGFRRFRASGNNLILNNNPIYLKMVLHQGYYPESGLTPPSVDALEADILLAKKLGFNGIRMHQKIEDERFYALADELGMIVWCEMPSPYEWKGETITNLMREWEEIVRQRYNHASICVWVPINESWGIPRVGTDPTNQHLSQALYHLTKAIDPIRPVISNDGWEHTTSDIITLHDYAQSGEELAHFYDKEGKFLQNAHKVGYSQTRLTFAEGFSYHGEPVMVDEFVGTCLEGREEGWGYGVGAADEEEYLARIEGMIKAITANDLICGYCITQLSDVEAEVNGLVDYHRRPKVDLDRLAEIIKRS